MHVDPHRRPSRADAIRAEAALQAFPSYSRFMQADPLGYEDGMNGYIYAANDPINRSDSAGLASRPSTNAGSDCEGEAIVQCYKNRGSGSGQWVRGPGAPTQVTADGGLIVTGGRFRWSSNETWNRPVLGNSNGAAAPALGSNYIGGLRPAPGIKGKPNQRPPQKNYCGAEGGQSFPPGNWNDSCRRHDECYGAQKGRIYCDVRFTGDILATCSEQTFVPAVCIAPAIFYGVAVFTMGRPAYNKSRRTEP